MARSEPYSTALLFDHALAGDLQNDGSGGRMEGGRLVDHAMSGSRDPRDLQPRNVGDLQCSVDRRIIEDVMLHAAGGSASMAPGCGRATTPRNIQCRYRLDLDGAALYSQPSALPWRPLPYYM